MAIGMLVVSTWNWFQKFTTPGKRYPHPTPTNMARNIHRVNNRSRKDNFFTGTVSSILFLLKKSLFWLKLLRSVSDQISYLSKTSNFFLAVAYDCRWVQEAHMKLLGPAEKNSASFIKFLSPLPVLSPVAWIFSAGRLLVVCLISSSSDELFTRLFWASMFFA